MDSLLARLFYSIWKPLDWVFPPSCVNCVKSGYQICPECRLQINYLFPPICEKCGVPRKNSGMCNSCKGEYFGFDFLRSMAEYKGPIRKIIVSNKFKKNIPVGIELSKLLSAYVKNSEIDVDTIIPIPLGEKRLVERGYNQVGIFAYPLSLNLKVKYSPRGLRRIRETKPQLGLSAADRKINVRNAFQANREMVSGKKILLVDDVATTGSTLSSASDVLTKAGANKVVALTCARVIHHQ